MANGRPARSGGTRAALAAAVGAVVAGRGVYRLVARGRLTFDTGIGRRVRALGPVDFRIAAPREVVFDVIVSPYLGQTPKALQHELAVWERGSDMVLAAHFTEVKCGTTTTVETVRFDRPGRVDFRVVRGPVPHVVESFVLEEEQEGTRLRWQGELGTDFWGRRCVVGRPRGTTVGTSCPTSIAAVTAEAERRATPGRRSAPT